MLTLADARLYVKLVRWKFAETMPQWPHEYTVKTWQPELSQRFESFCALILREGIVIPYVVIAQ
jgi:hypothetical protein